MTQLISAKKTLKELREKFPNNNTYKKKISEIAVKLRDKEHSNKKIAKALEIYRAEMLRIKEIQENILKEHQCTEVEKDKYESLDNLRNKWRSLEPSVDKLMTGFYLFYPALRSDWSFVDVKDGMFVFDKFLKRKEGDVEGEKKKPIVPELKSLLKYIDNIPRNKDSFRRRLNRIFNDKFGKNIGINILRKIWVSENRNVPLRDRETLATEMNHSVSISRLYYEKEDLCD